MTVCAVDFASCKKYTESYRGVPGSYVAPRCSGRTNLCNEVHSLPVATVFPALDSKIGLVIDPAGSSSIELEVPYPMVSRRCIGTNLIHRGKT